MGALHFIGPHDATFGGSAWRPPGHRTIRQQEVAERVNARLCEKGMAPRRPLSSVAASPVASAPAAKPAESHPIREDRPKASWIGSETTGWRGRSGARFIFGVLPVAQAAGMATQAAGVFLAVARGEAGTATIVSVRSYEAGDARYGHWLEAAIGRGATEIHIHRLAVDAAGRAAVVADLCDPDRPRRAAVTAAV